MRRTQAFPGKTKRRPLFQGCSILPSDPSPPIPARRSGADALAERLVKIASLKF